MSYARNVIAEVAYRNSFSEVIRVYCDNIVYKSNVPFNEPTERFVPEAKTSGRITFKNAHRYTKLD